MIDSIRVLHLIPTLGGGGAERQLALLAPALAERGVEVGVSYHTGGPNLEAMAAGDVSLFPLRQGNNHNPAQLFAVCRLAARWRPDLIQTWLPQMDILGGLAAHFCRVPHVLSERSSSAAYGDGWKSRLRGMVGRRARAIIANSEGGARYWREKNVRCPVFVVPNAVTPFEPTNAQPLRHANERFIVYVGRLSHEKNLQNLVASFALALNQDASLTAYILGAGPLEAEVRHSIEQHDMGARIKVEGYVDNLPSWYAAAEALVTVSDFEGHPNVVLEAANAGCPLILSDIPQHREAIPADAALFVDGHAPDRIAESILQCLGDPINREFRVSQARASVRKLSVQAQSAMYQSIYQELQCPSR
jgi:glycosyltransferase involved in cell wall biosynthesis